jgi:plasmid stability protein
MKNITVTVEDELYHNARIRAAEKRTSVSALVREFLERLVESDAQFERLLLEQNALIERIRADHPGFSAADRLTRDALHERHALR